jgi:hypothetical protein
MANLLSCDLSRSVCRLLSGFPLHVRAWNLEMDAGDSRHSCPHSGGWPLLPPRISKVPCPPPPPFPFDLISDTSTPFLVDTSDHISDPLLYLIHVCHKTQQSEWKVLVMAQNEVRATVRARSCACFLTTYAADGCLHRGGVRKPARSFPDWEMQRDCRRSSKRLRLLLRPSSARWEWLRQ